MPKGKNFSEFTYGVGLEVNAESFKQVKDDLKINLKSLNRMVKDFEVEYKVNPNAMADLFERVKKLQSIVDGINNSDNSFADFVDKGVLDRIATLENNIESISTTSKELEKNLSGLKSTIVSVMEPLKTSGEIKFPATFENLFGDFKDQSSNISKTTDQIDKLTASIKALQQSKTKFEDSYDIKLDENTNTNEIKNWLNEFQDIQSKLKDKSKTKININELETYILKLSELGQKLNSAMLTLGEEGFNNLGFNLDSQKGNDLNNFLLSIPKKIDSIVAQIEKKRSALNDKLNQLYVDQSKYDAKISAQRPSNKSLGTLSDYTAQVKVTAKTNESEWISKINDTITNITPRLTPVKLTPTFSNNSKNIEKEIDGSLAQVNHAINVDLKVTDNILQFNDKIQKIDKTIQNARQQLEKEGNFKIKFEYEEGGKFKDAAYKIINKFKQIDAKFYIANGKKFIQDVAGLREKSRKELTNIPTTFAIDQQDKILSDVDSLRSEIEKKIGNIGVNLSIKNIPQLLAEMMGISDSVVQYNNNPTKLNSESNMPTNGIESATNKMEELSEAAIQANKELEESKKILESLTKKGFDSDYFSQLGDMNSKGKKVKNSTKKIEELLKRREELKVKLPDDISEKWQELYPEANGQFKIAQKIARGFAEELKKIEINLNGYLQKQIAYEQSRYEAAEKVLQKEKEIADVKKQSVEKSQLSSSTGNIEKDSSKIDDEKKKINSLKNAIRRYQKTLDDFGTKKLDSIDLDKLRTWNKKSNSFNKNDTTLKNNIQEYRELKKAREDAGGEKPVGEELKLRNKLVGVLREQKKHISEIIGQKKQELEITKQTTDKSKNSDIIKQRKTNDAIDVNTTSDKLNKLNKKLKEEKKILKLLESSDFNVIGSTGIKDINNRLASSGSKQTFKDLINFYDKLIAKRKELEQQNKSGIIDDTATTINIDKLTEELVKLQKIQKVLKNDGQRALGFTGLDDIGGRLKESSQNLKDLMKLYNDLISKKKEFEANGDTKSVEYTNTVNTLQGVTKQLGIIYQDQSKYTKTRIRELEAEISKEKELAQTKSQQSKTKNEYVQNESLIKEVESKMSTIYQDQLNYTKKRIGDLESEISKEKELLQVKAQQTKELSKQHSKGNSANKAEDNVNKIQTSAGITSTNTVSNTVKLDGSTLNSLAKDTTLKSIDGKINSIINKLGSNIKIAGSNISIEANNVSVSGKNSDITSNNSDANINYTDRAKINQQISISAETATKEQKKLNDELIQTQKIAKDQTSSVRVVSADDNKVKQQIDTFRSQDKVTEVQEIYRWRKHDKDDPGSLEHTSTVYKTNMETYNKMYQDFISSLAKYNQIKEQIDISNGPTSKLQEELKIQKEIVDNLELQLKKYIELYTQESKQVAIIEATQKSSQEIAKITATQSDNTAKKVNTERQKYDELLFKEINLSNVELSDEEISKLVEYEKIVNDLEKKKTEIESNRNLLSNTQYMNEFNELLLTIQHIRQEFEALRKENAPVSDVNISNNLRQLAALEEQIKRAGLYSDDFKQKIESLRNTLNKKDITSKELGGYKIEFNSISEEFNKMKTYQSLYDDLVKSRSKQIQLGYEVKHSKNSTNEASEKLKIEQEISKELENQLKQYEEIYNKEASTTAWEEARKKANQEILKSSAAQSDKDVNKQINNLVKLVDNAKKNLQDMQYSMENSKIPMAESAIAKLKEYEQLLTLLKEKQQEIIANPSLLKDEDYSKSFNELLLKMKSVQKEFGTLQQSSESFLSKIKSTEDIKPLEPTFDITNLSQLHNAMQEFANQSGIGTAKLIEFNDAEKTATFTIQNGKGQVQQLTIEYDAATNSLGRYISKTKESQSETQKFIASLKTSFQNVARYVASFGSVYRLFAMVKQGITYVREIDSALTELKKVTDETDETYQKFLQTMSNVAGVVGSTTSELTQSASDWARLGYSIEEAGELAKNTAILMNVSEFDNVNDATEALISSLQAFGYEASNSIEIVDKLNIVGKMIAQVV